MGIISDSAGQHFSTLSPCGLRSSACQQEQKADVLKAEAKPKRAKHRADKRPKGACREVLSEPLDYCSGEHVQWQVVGSTGLGVGAAHAEAPEGLDADEGAGDAAIEVDAAREAVGAVVGGAEGFVEVTGLYDRKYGAEDLLARHRSVPLDREDGRAYEVAVVGISRVFAQDAVPLPFAHVYVARDLLELRLAYDGPDVHVGALGTADLERLGLLDDPV